MPPRQIKFKHFSSDKDQDANEAERLRKLKAELSRIKKQRLVLSIAAFALILTTITLPLLTYMKNNGTTSNQRQTTQQAKP